MKRFFLALFVLWAASAFAQGSPDFSGTLRDQNGNIQRVQYAFVNPSTITTTQIVAAQSAGVKIRVLAVACVPTAANTITFKSAANTISATFPLATGQWIALTWNGGGWFETNAAEALQVTTTVATATGCQVAWIPVSTSPLP
jgi:hypothetical protein